MLERFRPTRHPFNRPLKINDEAKDRIVIGGTFVNTFKLDFIYTDYVATDAPHGSSPEEQVDMSHAKVIYKQGFDVILEKAPSEFTIDEHRHCSYLTVILTPTETSMFKHNYLDVSVQVMVENKAGNLLYDIPSKLKVVAPLDYEEDITVEALNG